MSTSPEISADAAAAARIAPPRSSEGSLPEVHASVPTKAPSFWRRLFAFAGPAYMVSVGYMDPGNWATDIEGGSRFAYGLVWVLVMSNLMAVLLQTLTARLGIVTGRDLAQACRDFYGRRIGFALWVLCEIAIAACDLAEVLGTAIGLQLLFGIHLITGVVLTALDVFLLLAIQRLGIRKMEGFILALVATIGACFVLEMVLSKPDIMGIIGGLRPRIPSEDALYVAIGIIGATVMPHNLYLHSALVQTRQVERTSEGMREANRYNLIDSAIALNCALFVNGAILVLSAAAFHRNGIEVKELTDAHGLLSGILGSSLASLAFAIALLCAGQSSTLTGTLAGQVVMEGFLRFRMRPWLRRLVTRSVAIVPAVITIAYLGDKGTYKLLILSQVILSMQLPFAVIPLVQFTGSKKIMGEFASPLVIRIAAWVTALVIVGLNVKLVIATLGEWMAGEHADVVLSLGFGAATIPARVPQALAVGVVGAVGVLLVVVVLQPYLGRLRLEAKTAAPEGDDIELPPVSVRAYRKIVVAVGADPKDVPAVDHALSLARASGAELVLAHVAEGFGPRYFGGESTDQETQDDTRYLRRLRERAESQGVRATSRLLHGDPPAELARLVAEEGYDLLVMGAHGHGIFGDILYGSTIQPVRHMVRIPILIVREDGTATAPPR